MPPISTYLKSPHQPLTHGQITREMYFHPLRLFAPFLPPPPCLHQPKAFGGCSGAHSKETAPGCRRCPMAKGCLCNQQLRTCPRSCLLSKCGWLQVNHLLNRETEVSWHRAARLQLERKLAAEQLSFAVCFLGAPARNTSHCMGPLLPFLVS